eukprot:11253989-Alexandrium_andersonii.AAC.1
MASQSRATSSPGSSSSQPTLPSAAVLIEGLGVGSLSLLGKAVEPLQRKTRKPPASVTDHGDCYCRGRHGG